MTSPDSSRPAPDQFMDRATALLAAPEVVDAGRGIDPHALFQLYLADGLLEAVEWANDGVGSDEAACMWLASLRWHRTVTGSFPAGAPEPLARWIDGELSGARQALLPADPGLVSVLSRTEMGTPQRPHHDAGAPGWALLGATVPGLLPHVSPGTRRKLSVDAAALVAPKSAYDTAALVGPAVFEILSAAEPLDTLGDLAAQAPDDAPGAVLRAAAQSAAAHPASADAAAALETPAARLLAAALCGAARGTGALPEGWDRHPGSAVVLSAAQQWRGLVFAA
ncbi:hypothetical protein [Zhihengliuella salsuginis]|uniref:ADP-ribosylglycohydrolase n=1 Tax=Zhihengliuella salsuginis TaxID=578222 RepID=A0ABQ3GI89_9MICC|nr:hypothetical protein [Zhihengliuella salsuginis]GHD08436.1 hypothetical protein GCM10008096_20080 [Zhihengliuella salsuginis]